MYLYLQKLFAARTDVPRAAIWRHRMQENPPSGGAPPRTPLWELTALHQTQLLAGRGLDAPPHCKNPTPAFGTSGLASHLCPSVPRPRLVEVGDVPA